MNNENGQVFRPGFTKGSAERIAKALGANKNHPIPPQMIAAFDTLIKGAVMGQVGQMELMVAYAPDQGRKVRIIALPEDYGDVVEPTEPGGERMKMILVPETLGQVKKIDVKPQ